MSRRHRLALGVALSLSLTGCREAPRAVADVPPAGAASTVTRAAVSSATEAPARATSAGVPTVSPAASASAPASASSGTASAPAPSAWSEGSSPKPKPAEWKDAEPLTLARARHGCTATRLREWVRVACPLAVSSAVLIAGNPTGVSFSRPTDAATFHATFPARRGDRRVLELSQLSLSKWGSDTQGLATISELWLDGSPAPVITIN